MGDSQLNQVPIPKTDAEQLFVGFMKEYEYGINKKGTFGFLAKYEPLTHMPFNFEEYWAT